MSKTFTDFAFIILSAMLLLIAHGCASSGSKDDGVSAVDEPVAVAAAAAPGSGQVRKMESLPEWPPVIPETVEEASLPKVHRGNEAAFEQSVAALRAGRLREAETLLEEITADQPELAGPWVNLGQVYVLLDKYEEARMAFNSAIAANPRSCAAHNQLGVLSRQFGDFQAAEEHYRKCLEQVPDYKDAYLNLGILYELYLGRLPEALEAYRRYQLLAGEPDRKVQGWVVDLERRLGS